MIEKLLSSNIKPVIRLMAGQHVRKVWAADRDLRCTDTDMVIEAIADKLP